MSDALRTAIAELQGDIVIAKNAKRVFGKRGFSDATLNGSIEVMEAKVIAMQQDLNAPWRDAKTVAETYEGSFNDNQRMLVRYVRHLEYELADRPIVWAIQNINTKKLSSRDGQVYLHNSKEHAEEDIQSCFFEPSLWKAVIYTGRHVDVSE